MSIYPTDITEWPSVEVYGSNFTSHLLDAAETITKLELWDWFKNLSPPKDSGVAFWTHKNLTSISNGLQNNDHSGATFAYCIRCMQSIAKNGFENFKSQNNKN